MGKEYTEAQKAATAKYMEGRKTIRVVVTDEEHNIIKKHAEQFDGNSMNAFIKRAITETMERDKGE